MRNRHLLRPRNATLLMLLALLLPLVAADIVRADEAARGRQRPNVVFIMCDQLTAKALRCYGGPVPTPHIDRLAGEGVRFTQAVCPTPFCSPTRASIVTGMYPHAHGIVVNCDRRRGPGVHQKGITNEDVTTERLLHDAGYATHHYGKWHLHGDALAYYPDMFCPDPEYHDEMAEVFARVRATDRAGWMEWYTWALPVQIDPAFQKAVDALGDKWNDARHAEFIVKMGRLGLPLGQDFDVRVADHACERIRTLAGGDAPFMVTCSFNAPHDPNVVPSPYYEQIDPAGLALPGNRGVREARFERNWSRRIVADLGEPGLREFLRIYYGMVKLIDDQVGRILAELDRAGVTDETIIVFTADHGDMMGGHGMVWKSTSAFYDEIATVPLIIRYPRRLKPAVSDLITDLTDLMPTLLELTGRPIPRQAQGVSLVPFLTGERNASQARRFAFSERVGRNPEYKRIVRPGTKGDFMIRGQGLKYIRYRGGDAYLYDLVADPGETRNRIEDPAYADRRAKLSAELGAWLKRTGWPMAPARRNIRRGERKD
jgi:arylsulfatase A-like enzyme